MCNLSDRQKLKMGVNCYVNNLPLSCGFGKLALLLDCELFFDVPANLSCKCEQGFFDISSISFWSYKNYADRYKLLPNFCISGFGEIRSVKLLSKFPLGLLKDKKVFITNQSGSSSRAFKYYCQRVLGFDVSKNQCSSMENADAVFLIGDLALRTDNASFAYAYDFGKLYKDAFSLPIVYGAIAIKNELFDEVKDVLKNFFDESLAEFEQNKKAYCKKALASLNTPLLDIDFMEEYFAALKYKLSDSEFEKSLKFIFENELV